MIENIQEILKQRPSVHKLYYGAFIQESFKFGENVYAVPLQKLGFLKQANYAAIYIVEVCGGVVSNENFKALVEQGKDALPAFSLVAVLEKNDSPENLELKALEAFEPIEKILSWSTGDDFTAFAICTANNENTFFRLLAPFSRRRQRLGFGNTGRDYENQLNRMVEASENDEHFCFALGLFHDAVKENNQLFKIARLFSCLESLAYKLKKGNPSRKAVKMLLGLENGATATYSIDGTQYKFDRIEIAGRLRDKFFHGVPFKRDDLNAENQHVFDLLEKEPRQLADSLLNDCEIEFARWANGASNGLRDPS